MLGKEVPVSPERLKVFPDEKFEIEAYTAEDCNNNSKPSLNFLLNDAISDSLHGRRIVRALWDYYKVMGVINDSCYQLKSAVPLSASEQEGPGEAGFSMLKLKDIARQRELYSSIESFTSSDEYYDDYEDFILNTDEDDDDDTWDRRRRERRRNRAQFVGEGSPRRMRHLGRSSSSHVRDFITKDSNGSGTRRFDFLAYKRAMRDAKAIEDLRARQKDGMKVVGKNILPKANESTDLEELLDIEPNEQEEKEEVEERDDPTKDPWYINQMVIPSSHPQLEMVSSKKPFKPLTISTLRLLPAVPSDLKEEELPKQDSNQRFFGATSSPLKQPELFQEDVSKRLKVVGGGGVISRAHSNRSHKSSSWRGFDFLKSLGLNGSLHAEIRLDQISTVSKLRTKRSEKRAKRREKMLRHRRAKSACEAAPTRSKSQSPVRPKSTSPKRSKTRKKSFKHIQTIDDNIDVAEKEMSGLKSPPSYLSEKESSTTVTGAQDIPDKKSPRRHKKKLKKSKAVVELDL